MGLKGRHGIVTFLQPSGPVLPDPPAQPTGLTVTAGATLEGWIDDLIAEHPTYLFNAYNSFDVLDGHPELSDGVHPNHAGCVAMANLWMTALGY